VTGAYEALLDRAARENIPISASIELTNACNVDCEHCYLDLVPDAKLGVLTADEWKRVLRELAAEGAIFLTLTGGEILVRRDWFEIASYARELQFALRLFTNGTLVDDARADRIASLEPLGVEISILGASAATHDAIARRRGAFDKTIAGVRRLRERGIHVLLKTVVMQKNAAELARIDALGRELGCELLFDLQIAPKNDGTTGPMAFAPEGDDLESAALYLASRAESVMEPTSGPFDRAAKLAAAPCSAGRRTCFIGPTGDVAPCTQWATPLGNVRERAFGAIWWGDDMAAVRAKRIGSFATCRTCDLLEHCTPCMALGQLHSGVVDGPSPTKCRSTLARARALGVPGFPAGLDASEADVPSGLVQIRVPKPRKIA
jgi:radical SAM protein with 4Fe4S-binding SPASM domain